MYFYTYTDMHLLQKNVQTEKAVKQHIMAGINNWKLMCIDCTGDIRDGHTSLYTQC